FGIDHGDEIRQGLVAPGGDLFQCLPECIFEADAGPVASDPDRSLADPRFHRLSLPLRGRAANHNVLMARAALLRNRWRTVCAAFFSTPRSEFTFRGLELPEDLE